MSNLPPYAAEWLAKTKTAAARYETLGAITDVLSVEQQSKFAADQAARAGVLDAKAALSAHDDDVTKGKTAPDADARQRLLDTIIAKQRVTETTSHSVNSMTRVSAGTRTAFERTVKLVKELSAEAAEIELAKVKLPVGNASNIAAVQRDVLDGLDEEAGRIEKAMRPEAETLAMASAELNVLEQRGRIRVTASGSIRFPETPLPARPIIGSATVHVVDVEAMLVALHKDQLALQVEEQVAAMYASVPESDQLDAKQKRSELAAIAAKRFEVELIEVAAVFEAWEQGATNIGLRPETNPMAILGLKSWKTGERTSRTLLHQSV